MASVTADRVRDRVNLSSTEIIDAKVTEYIKDAEAEIELETDRTIDYTSCTQAEAAAITDLAAIYCICFMTGGKSVGLNFSLGDANVRVVGRAPPLEILEARVRRLIDKLRAGTLKRI